MTEGHEMKTHKAVSSKKKRGFTLTEVAIVLGIIGLILGAIWVAAAAVYNNMRVAHANTQILQIAQGVRGLYSSNSTTTGMTLDNIVCAKAVPSDTIDPAQICGTPATYLDSPFPNGKTYVFPDGDNYGFTISMSGVSRANCDNLLVQIAGASRDPGLFFAEGAAAVATGGQATTLTPITTAATPSSADAAAANNVGGCNAIATTGAVTLGFSLK